MGRRSSARTLDSRVIVFDKFASHEANGESGLSNTSRFGAEISGCTREIMEEEPTTKNNGIEFTHPRYTTKERSYDSASYGNQTE